MDKKNCITIITEDTIRYLIVGKSSGLISDTNFVSLKINKIDELGDCLWICWLEDNSWDITINKSEIIENKLDTLKYHFKTKLPVSDLGIPNELPYRRTNCAIFDFYTKKLSPQKGAIVEIN